MNDSLDKYLSKDFLYDELPCGFLSFKPDGSILSMNKTMRSWLGLSLEETAPYNFKTLLTKSSMLYYNLVIDPLLNLKSTINEINLKFSAKDENFDALLNAVSYKNAQGNVILINATVQKITDRKKYETELLQEKRHAEEQRKHAEEEKRRFEFLFNSAPNQIWTADAQGNVLKINHKLKEYFGVLDIMEADASAGVFLEDQTKTLKEWQKCLSTGKRFERETRLYGANKIPEWFLITADPYYNMDGEIEMWFGSNINIHRQKLLRLANEKELSQNLSSAYQTLEKKSELLVTIALDQSHMVRKPLANILGLAELIKNSTELEESKGLLGMLLQSVVELDEMIREVSKSTMI
jgi:PAS domain S-box-containing protein